MLNKRTHILFDQNLWDQLSYIAKANNTSIGQLVRSAVRKVYVKNTELEERRKAIDYILKHRPAPVKGRIDYKALINAGRRY